MTEWKRVRLGDVISINPRISLGKGVRAKKIQMEALTPGRRDIYSCIQESYSGGTKFRNGATLMARITPCLENGKIAQVRFLEENEVAFGSTEFIVLEGVDGLTDPNFVYYLASTNYIKQKAVDSMVGSSGRQRAQPDEIAKIEISLPPLAIQRKIAAVLGAIDDKIETNRKICANLEAQAQALFKSWFVDFEPFGGKMPKDWKMGELGNIVSPKRGKVITKASAVAGTVPVIAAGIEPAYFTDKHNVEGPAITISASGANAGYISLRYENIWASDCSYVSQRETPYIYFFYNLLKSKAEIVRQMQKGTAQAHVHVSDLERLEITVPDEGAIKQYNDIVSSFYGAIGICTNQSRSLASMRDALLPRLMSGEIDVEKVEVA